MKMRRILAGMAAGALAASAMAVTAFADSTKYYIWGGENFTYAQDLNGDDEEDFPGYGADGYEQYWLGTLDPDTGEATLKIPCAKGDTIKFATSGWEWYTGVQYTVTIGDWKGEVKYVDPDPSTGDHELPASVTAEYEVTDDVTEVTAEIFYLDKDESLFEEGHAPGESQPTLFNAWCSSRVYVVTPGGDDGGEESQAQGGEESNTETESKTETGSDTNTTGSDTNTNTNTNTTNNTTNTSTNNTATNNTATTGTSTTANPAASGDNTKSGAAEGIALAGLAVAGAAFVVSKKRK